MGNIIIAAALLGVCEIIGFVCFAWLLRLYFDKKQREIEEQITSTLRVWTEQPEKDKPSRFAELIATIGTVVGQAAAHSIMASLQADKSHAARAANTIADQVIAEQNPVLGLLTGGKKGKGAAIARLAQILGSQLPLMPGVGGNPGGNHSSKSEVQQRMERGGQ